jgi:putative phosphoribosyl transferase
MPFANRTDAGMRLGHALEAYRADRPIVIALPRGGVPVANEVAKALDAPLELLIIRKIGVPWHPELAMGAIVHGEPPVVFRNEDVISMEKVTETQFADAQRRELAELARRRLKYNMDKLPSRTMEGQALIIVDDGVATGATIRLAIRALRLRHPSKIVVAIPVAPSNALPSLRAEADAVVCLEAHPDFQAVGSHYRDFRQIDDPEVLEILHQP